MSIGLEWRRRILVITIDGIRLGPELRQHVVAAANLAFMTKRRHVEWRDDDPLTRSGSGVGEDPAVEVDDLTAAGPGVRRIVTERRALIRRHHVGEVLDR